MIQYTPGPWTVSKIEPSIVNQGKGDTEDTPYILCNSYDDAKLISKTPEMYEAIQRMKKLIPTPGEKMTDGEMCDAFIQELRNLNLD